MNNKRVMVNWSMAIGYPGENAIVSAQFNVPLEIFALQRSLIIQELEALLLVSAPREEKKPISPELEAVNDTLGR